MQLMKVKMVMGLTSETGEQSMGYMQLRVQVVCRGALLAVVEIAYRS